MKLKASGRGCALARELCLYARKRGLRAWAVGGCVRDWILGLDAKDIDVVADGDCAPLAAYCRRRYAARIEAFGAFGTVRCFFPDGSRVDFARTRAERYCAPAALPAVRPAALRADLARRDFAVNAMAASPCADGQWEMKDPFLGACDLRSGLVRALHARSFEDDPTRMYRACRFAARFGWKLEASTARLMRSAARKKMPALLSRARLRQELFRILEESRPGPVFALMRGFGLDDFVYPALRWDARAEKTDDWKVRLGVLAVRLGEHGERFLLSLEMDRALCAELRYAARVCALKRSPDRELTALQRSVAQACHTALPAPALKRAFVDGAMLNKMGFRPGKEYSVMLGAAAAAQWSGEFSSREGARKWLASSAFAKRVRRGA